MTLPGEAARVPLDPAIRSYYDHRSEEDRLQTGAGQLEAERTRNLIERHAPPPPAVVLDVGGAAGTYALWLASREYEVHLIDPVERLVEEARRRSSAADHELSSCRVADARSLPFRDETVDVVLLLGPLYHLTSEADRLTALAEAHRVLRRGGLVFAAAITRWASALDAIAKDYFAVPGRAAIVDRALKDGQHRNGDGAGGFTTAFFHRPDELRHELHQADLTLLGLYAIEGFAGFLPGFDDRWKDPRQRADIVRIAESLESEEHLLGASPHLLAVGRK